MPLLRSCNLLDVRISHCLVSSFRRGRTCLLLWYSGVQRSESKRLDYDNLAGTSSTTACYPTNFYTAGLRLVLHQQLPLAVCTHSTVEFLMNPVRVCRRLEGSVQRGEYP